ncbi:MAG: tetratricopeptide repeat protein, partial [bacterium]|nr:tetratricopeptide repeat protein [bacterium]
MRKVVLFRSMFVLLFFFLASHSAWGAETTKWFNLGIQAKKDDEKIKYFTKVIEIDPNHITAYNN